MKLFNTIKGLGIMLFSTKIFHPGRVFAGKRVAIIGAADSAFEKEMGSYIDEFDLIVRVNKAPHSLSRDKFKFIGSRTDVLFHSFYENNESGGGPIDFELYKKQGLRYLVNPNFNKKGFLTHLNYYKRNLCSNTTFFLSRSFYNQITEDFGIVIPTIGYYALITLLKSDCKELYISGFTFFKTPYAKNYRDHLLDMEENQKHIKKQGIHDPELEFQVFKKELNRTNCSNVMMDPTLTTILNQ